MKVVRMGSIDRGDRLDLSGMGGVEHPELRMTARHPEGLRKHLGCKRRAPHAEQDHIIGSAGQDSIDQLGDLAQPGSHGLGEIDPSEAIGKLGDSGVAPESGVLSAEAIGDAHRGRV